MWNEGWSLLVKSSLYNHDLLPLSGRKGLFNSVQEMGTFLKKLFYDLCRKTWCHNSHTLHFEDYHFPLIKYCSSFWPFSVNVHKWLSHWQFFGDLYINLHFPKHIHFFYARVYGEHQDFRNSILLIGKLATYHHHVVSAQWPLPISKVWRWHIHFLTHECVFKYYS